VKIFDGTKDMGPRRQLQIVYRMQLELLHPFYILLEKYLILNKCQNSKTKFENLMELSSFMY
jgi:hypothetical protein